MCKQNDSEGYVEICVIEAEKHNYWYSWDSTVKAN